MSSDKDKPIWMGPLPPYDEDATINPVIRQGTKGHHLAIMVGPNEWMPIVPGMIVALIKDRSKIDGVAPYVLTEMSWKPGKEFLQMTSVGKEGTERRILRLGSRYMGHHTPNLESADEVIDAATAATADPTKKQ